jgi:hypothetical protein
LTASRLTCPGQPTLGYEPAGKGLPPATSGFHHGQEKTPSRQEIVRTTQAGSGRRGRTGPGPLVGRSRVTSHRSPRGQPRRTFVSRSPSSCFWS